MAGRARDLVEKVVQVGPQVEVARHEAEVRVETSGRRVVVACSDMDVPTHTILFFADNECGLRVRLVSSNTLDDVRSRFG